MSEPQPSTPYDIEMKLLVEAIYQKYGYDFRGYARASLGRRIQSILNDSGTRDVSEIQHRILHDAAFFGRVLSALTITVTELFRDPSVYRTLREQVAPYLRTFPEVKIWHAGCATGEEVYSLAILLKEEDLLDRCLIYATDINPSALQKAREGIFPAERLRDASPGYFAAGGSMSLSRHYTAAYGSALMDATLRKRLVFSDHNLVTDGSFGEMNLVLCRNVLIYFDQALQKRALMVLDDSLRAGGFLCLGSRESLAHTELARRYDPLSPERIYRKVG